METTSIAFTQFVFPHGKPKTVLIDRPRDIVEKAKCLASFGCQLDIENKDEHIWMTAWLDDDRWVDRFCVNGPDVPAMVDSLINEAYEKFVP